MVMIKLLSKGKCKELTRIFNLKCQTGHFTCVYGHIQLRVHLSLFVKEVLIPASNGQPVERNF